MELKINDSKDAEIIVKIATEYKDQMDIDVVCWHYRVDACSILGVSSLIGNNVIIMPMTSDERLKNSFINDLTEALAKGENE